MKTIDIYANGPTMNFETIEDLKTNEKVRKTLFDEHGFLKTFYIFEDADKRNPLNNRFRVGLFNDGKWASIETDTLDEMLSALIDFNIQIKKPFTEILEMTNIIRHQKYKRCMAMAKYCRTYANNVSDEKFSGDEFHRQVVLYYKWAERWKEIAEQFKD